MRHVLSITLPLTRSVSASFNSFSQSNTSPFAGFSSVLNVYCAKTDGPQFLKKIRFYSDLQNGSFFFFRFCEKFRNSNLKLYERLCVFYICTSVCTFFTFVRAFVRFCKYWFPFLFFDSKPKIFSPTRLHNYSE